MLCLTTGVNMCFIYVRTSLTSFVHSHSLSTTTQRKSRAYSRTVKPGTVLCVDSVVVGDRVGG